MLVAWRVWIRSVGIMNWIAHKIHVYGTVYLLSFGWLFMVNVGKTTIPGSYGLLDPSGSTQVGFQVYIDDKGAGACDVTPWQSGSTWHWIKHQAEIWWATDTVTCLIGFSELEFVFNNTSCRSSSTSTDLISFDSWQASVLHSLLLTRLMVWQQNTATTRKARQNKT